MLGVGAAGSQFETLLLEQGFARNPQFGGCGPTTLVALPAKGVFATLVDKDVGLEVNATFSIGQRVHGLAFDTLDTAYIMAPVVDGDYNENGVVDAADYVVWRDQLGSPAGTLPNDPTGVTIGTSQFDLWRASFSSSGSGLGAMTVPEPTAVILMLVGSVAALRRHRAMSLCFGSIEAARSHRPA